MTWLLAFYLGGAVGSAALSWVIGGLDLAFFRHGKPRPSRRAEVVVTTVFSLFWPLSILSAYFGVRVFRQDRCDDCGCTLSPPCACFVRCGDCGGFHHGALEHDKTAERREHLH